ncbi:regulator of Vps4 activity in the MVB pathway-domain-containing protein [Armillaria nabsnona]|nr:regulator of Vps4 activity in the MVB pathway-domain-containing protein [Armillaria nabsnona]
MSNDKWDPNAVKYQLRLTGQRLGQLQERNDSKSSITRRDIATLLQQGNIVLARAKAQKLIEEDAAGDVLEMLAMYSSLLLEHFQELEHNNSPSPVIVEAASTIIFSAPYNHDPDVHIVRDFLVQRLGHDFERSATTNRDNYVSPRVLKSLSSPPPTSANLDMYLTTIAKMFGVTWTPEPHRQDILNELSEILASDSSPLVDLPRLRKLCSRGIPDQPPWLRPRIWKLFFGILPVLKSSWSKELGNQRKSYYAIRRLLEPLNVPEPPTTPLSVLDTALENVSKQLSRVPPDLFVCLVDEPESSPLCPLDDLCPEATRIFCASNLDRRLEAIKAVHSPSASIGIPEIRLESEAETTTNEDSQQGTFSIRRSNIPPTLFVSKSLSEGMAHSKHMSALYRLLYIHSAINPGNLSPHIPNLLVPLYSVLMQEIEPEDIAHAEADTFWLFEAVVGEFSELEDEEGSTIWMKNFGDRLAWADSDLHYSLESKGLSPALPHFSYRWLAPLLTQTLSYNSILVAWDGIFSRDARQRDASPRLEFLIDICTAMLTRARVALFRLGKSGHRSPGLWAQEVETVPPPSPLHPWELGDAFVEGMSLLQHYPIASAGGIDTIMQAAFDLLHRREEESKTAKDDQLSLGARIRVTMWKGFTNQIPSPERSPNASDSEDEPPPDDGNETERPTEDLNPGITSRLASTVWRGITNQSSMEPPPSPISPATAPPSPLPASVSLSPATAEEKAPSTSYIPASTRLWGYAEKLKASDTAATLAKVSTNWRAKALTGSWGARKEAPATATESTSPRSQDSGSPKKVEGPRRSLPAPDRSGVYSPPARPAYFRPPRDSVIFPEGLNSVGSAPNSPASEPTPESTPSLIDRTKNLQASLTSLTRPTPKAGPRPLLLNSSSLITSRNINRPPSVPSQPGVDEWSDVRRAKGQRAIHRESQSSVSSLSASDIFLRANRSDNESDTGGSSRRIPLNRRSVSPMAPTFRVPSSRHAAVSSATASPDRNIQGLSFSSQGDIVLKSSDANGWGRVDSADSPPLSSPLPPKTPISVSLHDNGPIVTDSSAPNDSFDIVPLEPPPQPKKLVRKKTPPPTNYVDDTSDSSIADSPSRSSRVRSRRRQPSRPPPLRIRDATRSQSQPDQAGGSLSVEWPEEDTVYTPRASCFEGDDIPSTKVRRPRKISSDENGDSNEARTRKISTESRTRKVSTDTAKAARRTRDSAAEEGDDEGYDDLLSAYESEEGARLA